MKKSFILIVALLVIGSVTACTSAASPTSSATPTPSESPSVTPIPLPLPPRRIPCTSWPTACWINIRTTSGAIQTFIRSDGQGEKKPIPWPNSHHSGQHRRIFSNSGKAQPACKVDYSDAEKLSIYREHKKVTLALQITPQGSGYQFIIRTDQNQGFRITGLVTSGGSHQ